MTADKITCKTCGTPNVPDWNGQGDCIKCTRDKALGTDKLSELVDTIWQIVKKDSMASSKIGYPSSSTRAKLAAALQEQDVQTRNEIKQAWYALNIHAGASAGSAQGFIVRTPWGEEYTFQADRDAFMDFAKSLQAKQQKGQE